MSAPAEVVSNLTSALGNDVMAEMIAIFKERWATLTKEEITQIEKVAFRFAELVLMEKAGYDVTTSLQILEATIENWKAAGQVFLYDAMWETFERLIPMLGVFAGKAIRAFAGF